MRNESIQVVDVFVECVVQLLPQLQEEVQRYLVVALNRVQHLHVLFEMQLPPVEASDDRTDDCDTVCHEEAAQQHNDD